MRKVATTGFILAMAIWVGGMAILGTIVAPAAFRTMPKDQAASYFGGVLHSFFSVEIGCGIVALLTAIFGIRRNAQTIAVSMMLALAFANGCWVEPRVAETREAIWHTISEILFVINLLIGLVAICLATWPKGSR